MLSTHGGEGDNVRMEIVSAARVLREERGGFTQETVRRKARIGCQGPRGTGARLPGFPPFRSSDDNNKAFPSSQKREGPTVATMYAPRLPGEILRQSLVFYGVSPRFGAWVPRAVRSMANGKARTPGEKCHRPLSEHGTPAPKLGLDSWNELTSRTRS